MLVICCGMPRSGSTLQFNMAAALLETKNSSAKVEWRKSSEWSHYVSDLLRLADDADPYVVKMHFPPPKVRELAEFNVGIRIVYIHRDVRDVVASMQIKFGHSLPAAIRRVKQSLGVEMWLRQIPKVEKVFVQEYESLFRDMACGLDGLANFLESPVSQTYRETLLERFDIDVAYKRSRKKKVSFERARRRLAFLLNRSVKFADEELMLHPNHVSEHKGSPGIWREHFSRQELKKIQQELGGRIESGFHMPPHGSKD